MNILKISTAICAVIFMASCNEKITSESYGEAGYITVTSQIGSQTKAGYETKLLPAEFVMDIVQGTDETYNYSVVMQNNGTGNRYTESTGKYLAWVNTDHSKVSVKAMTIPSGASLDENKILNISIERFQTDNATFIKNDILGATSTKGITITDNNINVTFQHLMSKLHIVYESTDDSVVEAIALGNVALEGAYSYADMEFIQNNNPTLGSIQMFQNAGTQYGVFAAEGIFCPFTPSASSKPFIQAKISGVDNPLSCEITLPSNFSFESGKRYVMKVNVTRNGISQVSLATENDWVKNVPGGKILWIGTSIPAGGGTIYSYPQMVANATGLQIVNNAVGGSLVTMQKNADWLTSESKWNYLLAGALSQTHQEAEAIYRVKLGSVGKGDDWVDEQMQIVKSLSYQSLIIPYIDGSIDNINTIVIDHGFNDLSAMAFERNAFDRGNEPFRNYTHLSEIISGEETYDEYETIITSETWNQILYPKGCYIFAMAHIINSIKAINPNVKIIIGNYFASKCPYLTAQYQAMNEAAATYGAYPDYENITGLINYNNKAVASCMGNLDIVNVYEFGLVTDETYNAFCPDGVHPSSDQTGKSNKAIADIYLQELAKIFSSTKTKSSSNSYDYGWEDVEIL